jgi:4-hydroxy-tetrahydrodipicolinate synthase
MARGRGEVLVGVGDTSFHRTLSRIRYVEQFDVDGIVVLSPFFYPLNQADLIAYFQGLADRSSKPLYLYDLPDTTKTKLTLETVLTLSKHPNILGIKCSGEWTGTRRLMDHVCSDFRVVPAQPQLVDMLIRCGIRDNLDGIYAIVPPLASAIARAAEQGDYATATHYQKKLTDLLHFLISNYSLFPACSVLLNARGVPGKVHQTPMKSLTSEQKEQLLGNSLVAELLAMQ